MLKNCFISACFRFYIFFKPSKLAKYRSGYPNYYVCQCMCVRVTALSGIYHSGPSY